MKNLYFLSIFLLSTTYLQAQKLGFGLKAGISQIHWDQSGIAIVKSTAVPTFNYLIKPETGIEIGGTAFLRFSERFTLNQELNAIFRTSKVDDVPVIGRKRRLTNFYLFIPIYVSYNFYRPLSLDFGGDFGSLIQSNDHTYQNTISSFSLCGVLMGLRYKISPKMNIQTRFSQAWVNIAPYINRVEGMGEDLNIPKRISKTFSMALSYNF